ICPLFVVDGQGVRDEIPSLPGIYRLSVDRLAEQVGDLRRLGMGAVLIYGVARDRDELAREALRADNVVARALRTIHDLDAELVTISDVNVAPYLASGGVGIPRDGGKGSKERQRGGKGKGEGRQGDRDGGNAKGEGASRVDTDVTLEMLGEMTMTHVRAGVDFVAPSAGMDGQVAYLREILDEDDRDGVGILACSVRYQGIGTMAEGAAGGAAGGERGEVVADAAPFRVTPANVREALLEVEQDVDEGADMVGVEPALASLDIICRLREETPIPIVAFSGAHEYQMIKAAAARGWIDGDRVMLDTLMAIKRAGADAIVTPFAVEAARRLGR
ncbi:MAG: hypothetical protein KAI47_01670, partial [Deltaproteobacteria bacterium]|nr:hypothetical protein [Deltaproteobacteria bacterium]